MLYRFLRVHLLIVYVRLLTAFALTSSAGFAAESVVFEGKSGAGSGKHVVFLTGDEEYRSEEGLVQVAKILAVHHGFKCTVLFSLDSAGVIDPTASHSLAGADALDRPTMA